MWPVFPNHQRATCIHGEDRIPRAVLFLPKMAAWSFETLVPKASTYLLPASCQHGSFTVGERTDDKLSVRRPEAEGMLSKAVTYITEG